MDAYFHSRWLEHAAELNGNQVADLRAIKDSTMAELQGLGFAAFLQGIETDLSDLRNLRGEPLRGNDRDAGSTLSRIHKKIVKVLKKLLEVLKTVCKFLFCLFSKKIKVVRTVIEAIIKVCEWLFPEPAPQP
jgi:hypothetical protein